MPPKKQQTGGKPRILPKEPKTFQGVPILQYNYNAPTTDFELYENKLTMVTALTYNQLSRIFKDKKYYNPPRIPPIDANDPDDDRTEAEYAAAVTERAKVIANLASKHDSLFNFILQTLSTESMEQLYRLPKWETTILPQRDPLTLWKNIVKIHCTSFTATKLDSQIEVRNEYNSLKQERNESLTAFLIRTNDVVKRMKLVNLPEMDEQLLALDFMQRLRSEYTEALSLLRRDVNNGMQAYPDTRVAMFDYFMRNVSQPRSTSGEKTTREDVSESVFVGNTNKPGTSQNKDKRGDKDKNKDKPKGPPKRGCRICKADGDAGLHWESECPALDSFHKHVAKEKKKDEKGEKAYHVKSKPLDAVFMTKRKEPIGDTDVLIDNQASVSIFANRNLLTNIRRAPDTYCITGIGGELQVNMMGHLAGVGTVLYHPKAGANIISFSKASACSHLSVNYLPERGTFVMQTETNTYYFPMKDGLHVCNFEHPGKLPPLLNTSKVNTDATEAAVFNTTVAANERLHTKRQVESAKEARELLRKMGYPSDRDFRDLIRTGGIINCPVTEHDAARAAVIYGPDVPSLKGKTVSKKPNIVTVEHVPRPLFSEQALHSDLMFVEGIPFLVSVADPLGLTTLTHLPKGKGIASIRAAILAQLGSFKSHGFTVKTILFDGESAIAPLSTELALRTGVPVEPVAPGSHVGKVERKIRLIKERMRCVIASLPYNLPLSLVHWLAYYCVTRINMLPSRLREDTVSPREAFIGRKINFKRDLRVGFGDYVQVHRENIQKNSIDIPRTEGAIALLPTGNIEGSCRFHLLGSGRVVTRARWTHMPVIPAEIIDLLNALASKQKKDRMSRPLLFRTGTPHGEDNVGPVFEDEPAPTPPAHQPPTHVVVPGVDDHDMIPSQEEEEDTIEDSHLMAHEPVISTSTEIVEEPVSDANVVDEGALSVPIESEVTEDSPNALDDVDEEDPEPEPPPQHRYELRKRTTNWRTRERTMLAASFAQYRHAYNISLANAFTEYQERTVTAVAGELTQMVEKNVFDPVHASDLDAKEMRAVIPSKMFLKEKFLPTGAFDKLKARLVAGGHRQDKRLYETEDISAPTVALTSAFIVATIAAMEKRTVATVDITGAYLNADMGSKTVLMRLDSLTAAILVKIRPDYKPYLTSKGCMIVKLSKALYGCVESAKLWYQHLSTTLEGMGFHRNPHDSCIFNCYIEGKQCTICVYVDDLLITSKIQEHVDKVVEQLRSSYKTITEHRGHVQSYLGMTFDFSNEGKVKVSMTGYVQECLSTYNTKGKCATPAAEHLFSIRDSPPLDTELSEQFHSRVAKLLYLAKRVRPDILTAISFLTTRTQCATIDDWSKLERVLRYLNNTPDRCITLSASPDDFRVLAYVDASYGMHADGKSHTGLCISLGTGPVFARSAKQHIVTKSSTEAELVGCSDSGSQAIWTRDFLIAQGYTMGPVYIHQDNTSTMSLIDKGKSTSDRTRHIAIRYFWLKDRISTGEILIVHLRTTEMVADLLTKSIQGDLFRSLRQRLLGDQ